MGLKIVILGLSITSSWGNGHATTYRALVKALAARGHQVTFLEREQPWYAENRDLAQPPYCTVHLYDGLAELSRRFATEIRSADLVIMGSYVPDGAAIGDWITGETDGVTAFYDIDTPVTLNKLAEGDCEYLSPRLIPRFDLYLSFTGGRALTIIEEFYGSPRARALYCSVDPELYAPVDTERKWLFGYLGTYSLDRQPALEQLLIAPARALPDEPFVVAGPQYPVNFSWPPNVERIEHVPPHAHARFYSQQRVTLNITRADMMRLGWSPSVRLFEAAACGVPIISDRWEGLDAFFEPGREILVAEGPEEVLRHLRDTPDDVLAGIGKAARARVLSRHTADHRAEALESYYEEVVTHDAQIAEEAF